MKKAEILYPKIKELLLTTTISQVEIAKQLSCSRQLISDINCGRRGYDENLTYPLRNTEALIHTCLSPNIISQIEEDIKNSSLSMAAIGRKYEIPAVTVRKINTGEIKKYYNNNNKYPLRNK